MHSTSGSGKEQSVKGVSHNCTVYGETWKPWNTDTKITSGIKSGGPEHKS